jgi:hypothetical protein
VTARRRSLVFGAAAVATLVGGLVAVPGLSAHSTAIPAAIAVNCSVEAANLVMDPPGKLRIIEYKYGPDNHLLPRSTGKVIAAADPMSRTLNPAAACKRIKAVKKPERGFAGPWPRAIQSRIECVAPSKERGLDFQLRPVLNKRKQVIGNRIVVIQQAAVYPKVGAGYKFLKVAVADGWLTRTGGGIKFAPTLCGRNQYP